MSGSTKNKKYIDPCLDVEKIQIDYIEENIPSVGGNSGEDDEGLFILEFVDMGSFLGIFVAFFFPKGGLYLMPFFVL